MHNPEPVEVKETTSSALPEKCVGDTLKTAATVEAAVGTVVARVVFTVVTGTGVDVTGAGCEEVHPAITTTATQTKIKEHSIFFCICS